VIDLTLDEISEEKESTKLELAKAKWKCEIIADLQREETQLQFEDLDGILDYQDREVEEPLRTYLGRTASRTATRIANLERKMRILDTK
jgi:hypothetical protein